MKRKILIVGGGFAGINILKKLSRSKNFDITLIDKNNYNFFPPLIYQVGSSILEPSSISYPFRKFLKDRENTRFRLAELKGVNSEENKVLLSNGELEYDTLIFATGMESNYFGMRNLEKYAMPMKTMNDALLLRNTLLERVEAATFEKDPVEQEKLLTVVVTGGGPAGVEISGVLGEIVKEMVPEYYKELKTKIKLYLVEGAPNLLGPMSEKAHKYSYQALEKIGVNILLNTQVKDCDEGSIYFANGEKIDTKTIIWTAGVTSRVFEGLPKEIYGRGRRLQVDEFNKVNGYHNIYAIGDTCIMTADPKYPSGHPQLAEVAMQQGVNLGVNLIKETKGEEKTAFRYHDLGTVAVIGRNKAVADLPFNKIFLKGFPAWVTWSFIHIAFIVSFGKKINTAYRWVINYVTTGTSLGTNYKIGDV